MLESEVKKITAIEVPSARRMTCSAGSACAPSTQTSSGTVIAPSPMPSRPAREPTAMPSPKEARPHSICLAARLLADQVPDGVAVLVALRRLLDLEGARARQLERHRLAHAPWARAETQRA